MHQTLEGKEMNTNDNSTPFPLGATKVPLGWNFAVYSQNPVKELVIAPLQDPKDITRLPLDPQKNRTGAIWHIFIPTNEQELLYGYQVGDNLLVDPYAKLIASGNTFGNNAYTHKRYKKEPIGVAFVEDNCNWEDDRPPNLQGKDLIIYEMHLRALTMSPTSHSHYPGTYRGVIDKIPYFTQLGINAIEFLPIFEFDETDCINNNPKTNKRLCNFWGYQPLSFFSPMQRYSTSNDPLEALKECKEMVKALHKAGIDVILDIVFNHTGEGNQLGHTISWKGFSEDDYYIKDDNGNYLNYSGCGNTLNCNHPVVADMLIESLRYWVVEMHVDGFRFDLASILMRGQDGKVLESSPLLDRITQDGILSRTKLIAEPWDAAGLHQVGHFFQSAYKGPEEWLEWNDDYRTTVRKFIKGTPGYAGKFATKLCGSQDLYGKDGSPLNSINYVTCHDGYTLRDLVSYEQKHNEENGEENRDGMQLYDSWNSGVEGETNDAHIEVLRQRQMKNFCVALLISSGVPMIQSGDEYGHTKFGNNNTWCQDNDLNWFQWQNLEAAGSLLHFWKEMIQFRKENPVLTRKTFFTPDDIEWHGIKPNQPDWSPNSHFVACSILDHEDRNDLYIAFNAIGEPTTVTIPSAPKNKAWFLVINTSHLPPQDICHKPLTTSELKMAPFSCLILKAI